MDYQELVNEIAKSICEFVERLSDLQPSAGVYMESLKVDVLERAEQLIKVTNPNNY